MGMATEKQRGPLYGVELIESFPIGGGMRQAMPSREGLDQVRQVNERVVAGYEVLLFNYDRQLAENERLKGFIRSVACDLSRSVEEDCEMTEGA